MAFTTIAPALRSESGAVEVFESDAFAGGTLRQIIETGASATYAVVSSTASNADGRISLALDADINSAPVDTDPWELVNGDGERWACDMIDAGEEGEPYEVIVGGLRALPGALSSSQLGGKAFTTIAPTSKL